MPNLAMHLRVTIAATFAVALVVGSCGGGSSAQNGSGTQTAAEQQVPLAAEEQRLEDRRLVTAEDLQAAAEGSVRRAFYDYWSAIENEEWSIALDYFPSEIRDRLRPETLVEALRIEAQTPIVKPLIRAIRTARGDQTSIRYLVRRGDGKLRPTSMTWRQRGGRWYIVYCSTLDDSYSSAVQLATQGQIDPTAKTPSKEALRAGARARRAQAAALEP